MGTDKDKDAPFWWPTAKWAITIGLTATISILTSRCGFPPKPVVEKVEVPGPSPVFFGELGQPLIGTGDHSRPTEGWVRDPAAIQANRDPLVTEQFDQTPAGKAVMGDEDTYLWQIVRKVANKGPPYYPNIDQKQVGCCVGCGWKHGADVCQANQIAAGGNFEFIPCSAEVIYGGSRVEVGGGRLRGDGSVGAWAAKWCKEWGLAPMQKFDSADLTEFSPARARAFGSSGVPQDIESLAKTHPIKTVALVKSWVDVKRAVQQGFPVPVCSDQGFDMQRDSTGTCRPKGNWSHCMCIIGVRTKGGKEQGFILNSWGNSAHTGPVDPPDAPVAGFWADSQVIERMVAEGDSFALSEVVGFPARKVPIIWFGAAPAVVPKGPRPVLFAQEVALSW